MVFLMFTIGLEFSLPKLIDDAPHGVRLGAAQVVADHAWLCVAASPSCWRRTGAAAWCWAALLAMSSTAIVTKMLAERLELNTPHGRQIIGMLLFQDLAVVPLLILNPALAPGAPGRHGARNC